LPCLREVDLHDVKFQRSVVMRTVNALPDSVEKLKIGGFVELEGFCGVFEHLPSERLFSRLRELDLSECMAAAYCFMLPLCHLFGRQMTTLRINIVAFEFLYWVHWMPNLEVLEADEMFDSDDHIADELLFIVRNLDRRLRHMSIVQWQMDDPNAFLILIGLRRTLRFLNVTQTNITPDVVDVLRMNMPNCEILQ